MIYKAHLKRKLLAIVLTMFMPIFCLCGVLFIKANAEEISVTSFVSVSEGATAEANKSYTTKDTSYTSASGLYINAPQDKTLGYTVEFNAIFTGSTGMKVYFPGEGFWSITNELVFTVASVSDPDSSFEIHIGGTWQHYGYVKYNWKGEYLYRTINSHANSDIRYYTENGVKNTNSAQYAPVPGHFNDSDFGRWTAYIGLEMEEDGIFNVVLYSTHDKYTRRVIASFCDETETFVPTTEESGTEPNLPKLDLESGYTVKLDVSDESDSDSFDFLVESIAVSETGDPYEGGTIYPLNTQTFTETPQWYDYWKHYRFITIENSKNFDQVYVGASITVPDAVWKSVNSIGKVESIMAMKPDGSQVSLQADGSLLIDVAGEWSIVYTTRDDESGQEFSRSFSFTAQEKRSVEIGKLISATAALSYDTDVLGYTGITVGADYANSYSGSLGKFDDTARISFVLPQLYSREYPGTGAVFKFTVNDLNGNSAFEIVYENTGWYTSAYVVCGDRICAWAEDGSYDGWDGTKGTMFYTKPSSDQFMVLPGAGIANKNAGLLELIWEGDILTVAVTNRKGNQTVIAEFDGSVPYTADELDNKGNKVLSMTDERRYGLPKMDGSTDSAADLKSGYTVSFSSNASTLPVTFLSVNGVNFENRMYFSALNASAVSLKLSAVQEGEIYYIQQGSGVKSFEIYKTYSVKIAEGWWVPITIRSETNIDVSSAFDAKEILVPCNDFADGDEELSVEVCVEKKNKIIFAAKEDSHGTADAVLDFSKHYLPDRAVFEEVLTEADPGYTFIGWYTGDEWEDGAFTYDDLFTADTDVKLFAYFADVTPPQMEFAAGVGNVIGAGSADFTVSDSDVEVFEEAGSVSIQIFINGTLFEKDDDLSEILTQYDTEYKVTYVAQDLAGNSAQLTRVLIMINTEDPSDGGDPDNSGNSGDGGDPDHSGGDTEDGETEPTGGCSGIVASRSMVAFIVLLCVSVFVCRSKKGGYKNEKM